jgi:hypothetical protein
MAGTSAVGGATGAFTTFCFLAAGALAGGAFLAGLFAAAFVALAGVFDLLAVFAGAFAPFLAFSSAFPFLVSAFFAPLAGVLEGFSALPVSLDLDLDPLVSFSLAAAALAYALVYFGLSASSALTLAV